MHRFTYSHCTTVKQLYYKWINKQQNFSKSTTKDSLLVILYKECEKFAMPMINKWFLKTKKDK